MLLHGQKVRQSSFQASIVIRKDNKILLEATTQCLKIAQKSLIQVRTKSVTRLYFPIVQEKVLKSSIAVTELYDKNFEDFET